MLKFTSLAIRRGPTLLFEQASFSVHAGQKIGLTGGNGTGKSSLFALIQNQLSADQGDFSMPDDWVIAHVAQETRLNQQPAIDFIIDGDHELRQTQSRLANAERNSDANNIAACHARLEEIDGYQAYSRAARLMSGLGFDDAEMENPISCRALKSRTYYELVTAALGAASPHAATQRNCTLWAAGRRRGLVPPEWRMP